MKKSVPTAIATDREKLDRLVSELVWPNVWDTLTELIAA